MKPNECKNSTLELGVEEVLRTLRVLCDYAYEQGFHEMGYDPVEEITRIIKDAESVKK